MKTVAEPEAHAIDLARERDLEAGEAWRGAHPLAPAEASPADGAVHSLQRSLGNGVARRILQPKLTVGAPDDIYEKEADAVAEQVMARTSLAPGGAAGADDDDHRRSLSRARADQAAAQRRMLRRIPIRTLQQSLGNRALARLLQELNPSSHPPEITRKCACGGDAKEECAECSKSRLARQRSSIASGNAALEQPPIVEDVFATSGQPRADSACRTLEPGFGHDFGGVLRAVSFSNDNAEHETYLSAQRIMAEKAPPVRPSGASALQRQDAGTGGGPGAGVTAASTTATGEMVPDDPYPATSDGEQPGLFSLSDEGFEFIKRHEGVKLNLYNDSQGHCTIGVGHLVHQGNCNGSEPGNFRSGLTEDEAMDLFRDDLAVYEAAVSGGVTSRLNQYYFDALVSFTYNVGIGAFQGSGVLKQVNAKNYSKVPGEMLKWVKPPEIKGRRTDEANLFRTGQY